jgi:hypothetical protein
MSDNRRGKDAKTEPTKKINDSHCSTRLLSIVGRIGDEGPERCGQKCGED